MQLRNQYLEAGRIVNTHGLSGEVMIEPWCDSPEFLCGFDTFYIDGAPVEASGMHIHKGGVLARLGGATDIDEAMKLKGKIICIDRNAASLPPGHHFISDLVGLDVLDASTGEKLGVLAEVLTLPASDVYVVRGGKEYFIPAVKQFILETDVEAGFIKVNVIKGMATDEV